MDTSPPLHIVLHQPEIPQNTGNIGRTCVAIGAKLWLVRPLGFRIDTHHLRRAGLDYWDDLDWQAVDDWADLQNQLAGRFWFFSKSGRRLYTDVAFERGDVLVFGSETQGLPDTLMPSESTLRLPMSGPVRSLNLSTTVGIAAYEALRQWNASP